MLLPALFFFLCLHASDAFSGACHEQCLCYGGFVSCHHFTEEVLNMLPTTAETLVLYGGEIKSFPPGFLQNLTKLSLLEIQSSRVDTVLEGTFVGPTNLVQLAITTCTIGRIEAGAFTDMDDLSQLFVSESQIGTIQTGAFSRLNNVGQFNIWSSKIGTVERWAFSELSDVQSFAFYMNNVTVLSNDAFVSMTNIDTVDVYLNRFANAIQGGSGMDALKAATAEINVYSNVFVCGCDFVKAFQHPLLSRFVNSQKCARPGSAATVKLSEIDVDEACADTTTKQSTTTSTAAQTTSSPPSTSRPETSTFTPRPASSRNTTWQPTTAGRVSKSDAGKPSGNYVTTSVRPARTTVSGDASKGGLFNTGAGSTGVFQSSTATMAMLLQASLVSFVTTLLVSTTWPIASVIS